jgi:UDP-N-acetylmuramate--alanine ligase
MKHVHLIGIGGSGLSAIARLLLERGWVVSGSDREASAVTEALQAAGARVYIGHHPENVRGSELVVRSSAIPLDHVEVRAALDLNIPVLKRSEFLGQILEGYKVIAVAGTHGKTTTTAMVSWVLESLNQEPSYIIGGVARNLSTNAHAGNGPLFVIEADEYDRMFLGLQPDLVVVTNVEHDHPDDYPTSNDFYQAFREFTQRLTPQGTLLGCIDDPGARRLLEDARSQDLRVRSYGLNHWLNHNGPDYAGRALEPNQQGGFNFEMVRREPVNQPPAVRVSLQVPGRHNVSNAVAALAVTDSLELPLEQAAQALSRYRGVDRRFDVRGEAAGVTVIDDYAHHPGEIRATLAAARIRFPGRPIWVVWQPHTYSRTRTFLSEFAVAFGEADHLLVTEIYAAREGLPADGFSSRQVVAAIVHPDVQLVSGFSHAVDLLMGRLHAGDVVLVLSAGDAIQISSLLFQNLDRKDKAHFESSNSRSEEHV